MLERIKDFIRGVARRVLGEKNVMQVFGKTPVISRDMQAAIDKWTGMYEGNAPWLSDEVKPLGLPAMIASELARLTTIELKSVISGESLDKTNPRAQYLGEQYGRFLRGIRPNVERALALGGMILKPYIYKGRILVDCVQADSFEPLGFSLSGEMTDCVFADRVTRDGYLYTRLERHELIAEGVRVTNRAYRRRADAQVTLDDLGQEIALDEFEGWSDITPELLYAGVDRLLVSYFKVPFANTVDRTSPLGISAFARAESLIEQADRQYSRLLWEFESGERALYTDETAFERDHRGNLFLPDKRLYRTLNIEVKAGENLFEDWTPELREQSLLTGLDAILCRVEDVTGLARGTLSKAPESSAGGARTATEIRVMRQRTFATITDLQQALGDALDRLVWAMDIYATKGKLAPEGQYTVTHKFDDSVISDRQIEFNERMQLVSMNAMQLWELRAWYLDETEAIARAAVESDLPEGFREDE